jgi:hypothetical protein
MGSVVGLLMWLLLATATLAYAQEVRPGDQVRLIEREQHIPAHPAPGESRVSLRFVSGSQVTVLAVNPATSWIEVQEEPLQGTINTGYPPFYADRFSRQASAPHTALTPPGGRNIVLLNSCSVSPRVPHIS